jgi:ABC-type uncharacterized transport system ATPase subunit
LAIEVSSALARDERAANIAELMKHLRAMTVLLRVSHDSRYVSHKLWGDAVMLMDSIGRQGGGWLKSASHRAPAA